VAKPYVLPGTTTETLELCDYCFQQRERETRLSKHTDVAICREENLIVEDDYAHYFSSYTLETLWYCDYCEEMKNSEDVYEKAVATWCCPTCHEQYGDEYDAANCCD
jgi:hypothetical protein